MVVFDPNVSVSGAGPQGVPGDSAFVYIRYAADNIGTGIASTPDASRPYIAVLTTDVEIVAPVAADFTGLWFLYKGATGANGTAGVNGTDPLWLVSASDPVATDDSAHGYSAGSGAINTATHKVFFCESAGVGAASWREVVLHRLASAENDFMVATGVGVFAAKSLADTKTVLGITSGPSFWTVETNFTAAPASTSTLTMTADKTATILVGCGLKYAIGGVTYYGVVTAITSNLLTISGPPLGGNVTSLYWSDPTRVIQLDFFIPGLFADAANTGLLASDARTKFAWRLTKAYLVQINHTVRVADTGANNPRVTVSVNGSVVGTDNTNTGLGVAVTWTSTVVGINTSNYDINYAEAIEIVTDANGSNDDAKDLTVSTIWVIP